MAKSYTKLRYFCDAIKRCPEVKLTYVPYTEYVVIGLDDWKALNFFNAIPKSYRAEWGGRYKRFQRIVGYRVSNEVAEIIKANCHLMEIGRYL